MKKECVFPEKISPPFLGFLQASFLFVYVFFCSLFFANPPFGKSIANTFLGPLMFLLLFVISALICALISLGYPLYLAFNKQIRKAIVIILWTLIWLILFGVVVFLFVLGY